MTSRHFQHYLFSNPNNWYICIVESNDWEKDLRLAFQDFLLAIANGEAKIATKLLKKLEHATTPELFRMLVNDEQRTTAAPATGHAKTRHPARPRPQITISRVRECLIFTWECDQRNKHSPDAADTTNSQTTIRLRTNPVFQIEIAGTNTEAVSDRAAAAMGFRVPTAAERASGKK